MVDVPRWFESCWGRLETGSLQKAAARVRRNAQKTAELQGGGYYDEQAARWSLAVAGVGDLAAGRRARALGCADVGDGRGRPAGVQLRTRAARHTGKPSTLMRGEVGEPACSRASQSAIGFHIGVPCRRKARNCWNPEYFPRT